MSKLFDLLSAMIGKIKRPDWNQNDPTQPDYVKNRPFYEDVTYLAKWVGEETEPFCDHWYKVSDTVLTLEEITGKICECPQQGISYNLTTDVFNQRTNYINWYVSYYQDTMRGRFVEKETVILGITFTPGIYVYDPGNLGTTEFITGEWYLGKTGTVHKIPEKYLPEYDMVVKERHVYDGENETHEAVLLSGSYDAVIGKIKANELPRVLAVSESDYPGAGFQEKIVTEAGPILRINKADNTEELTVWIMWSNCGWIVFPDGTLELA